MIDLNRETPVTLDEAPRLVPAINAVPGMEARPPLHRRTIYNWATRGKRGITLETASLGGILVTTREALARFFEHLTAARQQRLLDRPAAHQPTRRRSPATQNYEHARARLARDHGI